MKTMRKKPGGKQDQEHVGDLKYAAQWEDAEPLEHEKTHPERKHDPRDGADLLEYLLRMEHRSLQKEDGFRALPHNSKKTHEKYPRRRTARDVLCRLHAQAAAHLPADAVHPKDHPGDQAGCKQHRDAFRDCFDNPFDRRKEPANDHRQKQAGDETGHDAIPERAPQSYLPHTVEDRHDDHDDERRFEGFAKSDEEGGCHGVSPQETRVADGDASTVPCYAECVNRFFALFGLFCATVLLPGMALAQDGVTAADEAQLTSLYRSLLRYPDDAYIQKRIEDERTRIRAAIEKEIRSTPRPSEESPTPLPDGQESPTAIDQQRALLTGLEERLKERKVDRDLLLAEKDKYYGTTPPPETEETDDFRLTKSHEEILAKVAIAQERIAVLESVLSLEKQRLGKLTRDQWVAQFGDIIRILSYVGSLIALIVGERIARGIIAHRIPQPQRRYVVTKLFTTTVFTIVLLWLLTTIFSKNPNILTSLAIVGAGLAVALQDVVKDIVGWIIVLQKRLYMLGDRISVGPYTGDVVDLSLMRTTLLEVNTSPAAAVQERTGRTLYMPNAAVLVHDVVNFNRTSDYLKSELKFTLTLESNWVKAEKILREILEAVTGKYTEAARRQYSSRTRTLFIQHDPTGPTLYTDLVGDGIEVTLRFTIPIGMRRDVGSEIVREMLRRFAHETDIGLAYRTSMVYNAEHQPPPLFHERKT